MSNPQVLDSPSAGIGSWRRSAAARGLRSRAARRVLLVLLLGALLVALLALLLRPFWLPDVHLHTLEPGDAAGPAAAGFPAPPAPDYLQNDLPALEALGEQLSRFQSNRHPAALSGPRTPSDWQRVGRQVETIAPGGGHIMLLYAAGHGVIDDGAAWLTWKYGAPGSEAQRVRTDDLLRQLRASPARTKLLLLDAGRIEYDPARGAIVNDFSRLLAQDVLASGDESLWVLVSHSVGQRSHVSHLLKRSLFGYFVTRGLQGEADLDGDRRIDLAELHGYVSAQIGHWLRQNTGDDVRQTPVLLWGGGTSTRHVASTVLLPVAPAAPAATGEAQAADEGETPAEGDEAQPEAELFPESVIVQSTPQSTPPAPAAGAGTGGTEPAGAAGAAGAAADSPNKPTANGGAPATSGETASAAADSERVPRLLANAWSLRDRLAEGAPELRDPLGDTPHLWRELTARLMQIERVYRTGATPAAELVPALERLVDAFRQLGERRRRVLQVATPLEERIARAQPPTTISAGQPASLALAMAMAVRRGEPVPERIQKLNGPLVAFIDGGDAAEFRKWLSELPPSDVESLELRLARQLAAVPQLEPALFRLALQARRRAEHTAAAALGRVEWIRPLVEAADAERLAGERALLDQIGSDRSARGESHLRSSLRRYAETDAQLARLEAAERLQDRLIDRLPHYVRWYQGAGGDAAAGAPRHRDLVSLIESLDELARLLGAPNPDQVNHVGTLAARIASLQTQIEAGLDDAALAALVDAGSRRGAAAQIAAILETPLLDTAARFRLLRSAPLVESEPAVVHADRSSRLGLAAGSVPDRQAWTRLAELEVRIAGLSGLTDADASNTLAALAENLRELQIAAAAPEADPFWTSLHQLEQALSRFSIDLSDRIQAVVEQNSDLSSAPTREERRARLQVAARALRLVDARAADRLEGVNPAHALRPADVYDQHVWQRARLLAARADASPDDFDFLTASAATCRELAESVPGQPAVPVDALAPPDLIGPPSIALTSRPEQEFSLSLTHRGAASSPAWIVLDYDHSLLEVVSEPGADVYSADQLRASRRGLPPRPVEEQERPTWTLAPGAQASLQLTVRRREQAVGAARLIVKAIVGSAYIRREVPVTLPASDGFELQFATPDVNGTWSRGGEDLRLHPFPNRTTGFQLLLSYVERDRTRALRGGGSSPLERTANVSVIAPQQPLTRALPAAPLPLAEADALVRRLSGAMVIAHAEGVVVQSGGEAVALTLAPPPPAAAPPAAAAPGAAGAAPAGGAAAPPGGSGDQPLSLVHGLVVVIREPDAGVATLRHVEIAPQRPRRYVAVRVDYDREREEVVVSAAPRGPAALPAGRGRVACAAGRSRSHGGRATGDR